MVIETNGGGIDHVQSSVTFAVSSQHIEKVTLTGADAIDATGNSLANTLIGNSGANALNGSGGADEMRGGTGNDSYVVQDAADVVIEASGGGIDLVRSAVTFTLAGQNLENLTLTGTAEVDAFGNGLANILVGNSANNLINGSVGADEMRGGAGNDNYVVQDTGDAVIEGNGLGTDFVRSTVTFSLGSNVENLTLLGAIAIDGIGNGLTNTLLGNSASNILNGGGGNDSLTGGAGSDTFAFDTALGAANVDTIADFSVADDTIQLENGIFTALGAPGTLAASGFVIGSAAQDADDRILYDSASGALSYDADGTGAAAAIRFATLATGLALTSADFLIV